MSGEPGSFYRPRAAAGLLCILIVCVLALLDVLTADYQLDKETLFLLLAAGGTLLGVDIIQRGKK